MLGVYATDDVHLGDIRGLQLLGTLLNLLERHIPGIGIALATTKRTELAVEEAYVRRLEVHVAIVVDRLATYRTLAHSSQLAQEPQWRLAPQLKCRLGAYALTTTNSLRDFVNRKHCYLGALI